MLSGLREGGQELNYAWYRYRVNLDYIPAIVMLRVDAWHKSCEEAVKQLN